MARGAGTCFLQHGLWRGSVACNLISIMSGKSLLDKLTTCCQGSPCTFAKPIRIELFADRCTHRLRGTRHTVTKWHGDQDNCSPEEMSEYSQQQVSHFLDVRRMHGFSYYSTLYAAAPGILRAVRLTPTHATSRL
jgi:hypothetical protein